MSGPMRSGKMRQIREVMGEGIRTLEWGTTGGTMIPRFHGVQMGEVWVVVRDFMEAAGIWMNGLEEDAVEDSHLCKMQERHFVLAGLEV